MLEAVFETSTKSMLSQLHSESVDFKVHLIQVSIAFRHYFEPDLKDLTKCLTFIVIKAHVNNMPLFGRLGKFVNPDGDCKDLALVLENRWKIVNWFN